jgi:hypothetical protein
MNSVDVTFREVVSRREQFLERVQVVAQRIVYRVRRAVISTAPDGPPGTGDATGRANTEQAETRPGG